MKFVFLIVNLDEINECPNLINFHRIQSMKENANEFGIYL